ncbi:hypothetical protein ACET3X_004101 [Alternaria dauci]|uniref:Uncharacterized protein n=1 Tax=Alternaria dauci TaxID=48095 RepID=A0ABR3UN83_9PLEO
MQRPLTLPQPQEVGKPPSTLGVFSMADMRLFHHFLITAYPHLPVGADKIWTTTIPGFAHRYEYLMHSILGLAASHLDAITHSGVAEQAIQHRILAMKSLNEALSAPPTTSCERDARMAAAIALAFQSSHLQDGMAEFLTMVRGCNLIGGDETLLRHDSIFSAFREDCHLRTMQMRVGTSPLTCVNHEDLDMAASSLNLIKALRMSEWERSYWEILVCTVSHAYDSPVETYTTFVMLYNTPSQWTHEEFQAFINPSNSVAQILLAHFIAIQAILTPILYLERVDFQGVHAPTAVLGWIEETYWNIPYHMRHHVEWPRKVSRYPFMRFVGQNRVEYCDTDPLPA